LAKLPKRKGISIEVISLEILNNFFQIYVGQLIPDTPAPCSIYTYFKGQYIEVVKKDANVDISFIAKMIKEENYFVLVDNSESEGWESYIEKRNIIPDLCDSHFINNDNDTEQNTAHVISLAFRNIQFSHAERKYRKVSKNAQDYLRSAIHDPMMKWIFNMKIDELTFTHNVSVAFLIGLFTNYYPDILEEAGSRHLLYTALFHELEGTPEENFEKCSSKRTLEILKEKNIVLPENFIDTIKVHDELISGNGLPGRVLGEEIPLAGQIFSIINYFDHLRIISNGATSIAKVKDAIKKLEEREEDFNQDILVYFKTFITSVKFSGT
jgi:hypothetical protein